MKRLISALILVSIAPACKQGRVDSNVLGTVDASPLPGPEIFEGGPTASCMSGAKTLTITLGPAGDFKWARLTDAPVLDGNPRVEYLQSDSSRVRRAKDGALVSGRWQRAVEGKDPLEAKVFFDSQPADCQVSGW